MNDQEVKCRVKHNDEWKWYLVKLVMVFMSDQFDYWVYLLIDQRPAANVVVVVMTEYRICQKIPDFEDI